MRKNLSFANRVNKHINPKGGQETFYNFALSFGKTLKKKV